MKRLLYVELRKCIDTRSARVLLLVLAALSAATALLASQSDPSLSEFIGAAILPLPLLLPILAILAVTSDWTQRSSVTTFALVPRRFYVLVARACAVTIFVVATVVLIGLVSAVVFAVVHPGAVPETDWGDLRETLWSIVAISLAASLSGIAIGSLLLNTPLAIVMTLLLPLTYELVIGAKFPAVAPWVSSLAFSEWLANPQWTWLASQDDTIGAGPALCSLVLWTGIPLGLGWLRQARKEVR